MPAPSGQDTHLVFEESGHPPRGQTIRMVMRTVQVTRSTKKKEISLMPLPPHQVRVKTPNKMSRFSKLQTWPYWMTSNKWKTYGRMCSTKEKSIRMLQYP